MVSILTIKVLVVLGILSVIVISISLIASSLKKLNSDQRMFWLNKEFYSFKKVSYFKLA
jgi:hypothetical protein